MATVLTKKGFDASIEDILSGNKTLADYEDLYKDILLKHYACNHKNAYYTQKLGYNLCDLAKVFVKCIQDGNTINNILLERFVPILSQYYSSYIDYNSCMKYNGEILNKLFDFLYDNGQIKQISNVYINGLASDPYWNNKCMVNYLDKITNMDVIQILKIYGDRHKSIVVYNHGDMDPCPMGVAIKLIDRYILDVGIDQSLEKLFMVRSNNLHTVMASILDKYDGTAFKFTDTGLKGLLLVMPYSQPLLPIFMSRNLKFTMEHLKLVIISGNVDAVSFVSNQLEYTADSILFKALINSIKYVGYHKSSSDYYYKRDNPINKIGYLERKGSGYSNTVFEILVNHGYVLTREDLKESICARIELPDIGRFNLDLDNEIYELCFKEKFYPRYTFKDIDSNLIDLERLCLKPKLAELKRFFKENPNIKPNKKCMDLALSSKTSIKIIDLLLEKGAFLDICNLQHHTGFHNKMGQKLIKKAIEHHNKKDKIIEDRINELENEIRLLKLKEITINSDDKIIVKRKKIELSDTIKEYFQITDKKSSYYDLKKVLLKWIKDNNFIMKKEMETCLVLPNDLTDIVGLKSGYINMKNLDDLVKFLLLV